MRSTARFGLLRFLGPAAILPGLVFAGQRALPKAEAQSILNRYYNLLHSAKTIRIVEEARHGDQWMRSETWLMKPYWRSVGSDSTGSDQRGYADAKSSYSVDMKKKTYDIMERFPDSPFLNGFEPFNNRKRPKYTLGNKVMEETFENKPAYKVETGEQSIPGSMVSVYLDRKTLMPIGWEYAVRGRSEFHSYKEVHLNEPMKVNDFKWKPPKGFKLGFSMPRRSGG